MTWILSRMSVMITSSVIRLKALAQDDEFRGLGLFVWPWLIGFLHLHRENK